MVKFAFAAIAAATVLFSTPDARADIFESQSARGMCLNVAVGGSSIQPCNGSAIQDIAVTPVPEKGGDALVVSFGCLSMPREGEMIATLNCFDEDNFTPSVFFTLGTDGTISVGNLCFDIKAGGRKAGTKVIAFGCNGQVNQRWIRQATGTDVNAQFQGADEARVTARLSLNSAPQLCLGPNPNGMAELQPCNTATELSYVGGGGLTGVYYLEKNAEGRVIIRCLSASGNQGQQLRFQNCTVEGDMMAVFRWGLTDNGLLRNDAGLCADAKNNGNQQGTPIILWKCSGKPNQRFTPIQ